MLRIYALFGVLFTDLNNVAVYQNGQISGMWNITVDSQSISSILDMERWRMQVGKCVLLSNLGVKQVEIFDIYVGSYLSTSKYCHSTLNFSNKFEGGNILWII